MPVRAKTVPRMPAIIVISTLLDSFVLKSITISIPALYEFVVLVVQVAAMSTSIPRTGSPSMQRILLISASPVITESTYPRIIIIILTGNTPKTVASTVSFLLFWNLVMSPVTTIPQD